MDDLMVGWLIGGENKQLTSLSSFVE